MENFLNRLNRNEDVKKAKNRLNQNQMNVNNRSVSPPLTDEEKNRLK